MNIRSKPFRTPAQDLFVGFLERYLSTPNYPFRIQGVQDGYPPGAAGLLLFEGPSCQVGSFSAPTTLAIRADIVLTRPHAEVLALIQEKVDASRAAFKRPAIRYEITASNRPFEEESRELIQQALGNGRPL